MLYPKLLKNIVISSNSTSGLGEVISPEMTMAVGLCLLAGASYIDLTSAYGISESSVFVARNLFVNAVNSCQALKVVFPDSEEDFNVLQNGFQAKSTHGLIQGCVGCIDGLLIVPAWRRPSKACGLVTSCTKWRSMYSTEVPSSSVWTTCSSQILS